ncbi:MAG: hypothetical protein MZW92_09200 [Comamonadaceae bacterium]|nr:hypothetical protein [Comamonadaceae bacterium]
MVPNAAVPLCVDLDGTLLNSDLLLETVFAQLKRQPLAALHWPRWLAAGKARLQGRTRRPGGPGDRNPALPPGLSRLPPRAEGRKDDRWCWSPPRIARLAERVAAHLGLFDRGAGDRRRPQSGRRAQGRNPGGTLRRTRLRLRRQCRRGRGGVATGPPRHRGQRQPPGCGASPRQRRSRTGIRGRRIAPGAVGQSRAPAPMAQERPDLRAVVRRVTPGTTRTNWRSGAAGLSQLRAVRLQRLSAQRPAGPGRRPPPSVANAAGPSPPVPCRFCTAPPRFRSCCWRRSCSACSLNPPGFTACLATYYPADPGLFAAAQAGADARRHRAGRAVHPAHHRRGDGGAG